MPDQPPSRSAAVLARSPNDSAPDALGRTDMKQSVWIVVLAFALLACDSKSPKPGDTSGKQEPEIPELAIDGPTLATIPKLRRDIAEATDGAGLKVSTRLLVRTISPKDDVRIELASSPPKISATWTGSRRSAGCGSTSRPATEKRRPWPQRTRFPLHSSPWP